MAFFRKAGNILGRTVSNHIGQELFLTKPSILQAIRCMSTSKLFIGGLSYSTDDASLTEAFNKYGEVAEARVIVDRETGRSRGFGFITYSSVEEASAAIQALDQQELHGRRIRVDYANDRTRGYGGGGFRDGNFGGGGGGGGGYNSGGFGGSYGTGGGYNNNDGYGGSYGDGGYGNNSNFNSGVNSYGSGAGPDAYPATGESPTGSSNFASNNGYDGGNFQGFCVSGDAGGGKNIFSSDTAAGSSGNDGFGDEFGSKQSNGKAGGGEGFGQDDSLEGSYRDDDDTPDNYADRRS